MSRLTKRKYVTQEVIYDFFLPEGDQQIVKMTASCGNNLHEVETAEGEKFLASMPTKFRRNVWIKKGDYVMVEPIAEGVKVKAEIIRILYKEQIKYIKEKGFWPEKFVEVKYPYYTEREESDNSNDDNSSDDDDLFKNTNRCPQTYYDVTDSEEDDSDDQCDDDDDASSSSSDESVKNSNDESQKEEILATTKENCGNVEDVARNGNCSSALCNDFQLVDRTNKDNEKNLPQKFAQLSCAPDSNTKETKDREASVNFTG